ncbi:MAG: glycosyltransferase [Bacteroidota bacterium]
MERTAPATPPTRGAEPPEASSDVVDVSVVIVNYNVREFLEQALRSLERARHGLTTEVFVVDNNSVDGSAEMVATRFPRVQLLQNEDNVGFGRANNQAIRQARGRFLFILNPDTIVREDTLRTFVAFMEAHPEAGAVGCKILNPDGSFALESRRAFPTPSVALYRMMGLSRLFPQSRRFGRYNMTYLPEGEVAEVDALSGSCMFVRRAALAYDRPSWEAQAAEGCEVVPPGSPLLDEGHGGGVFDEAFFMYGEDLDWCYRIQQAGWGIYYTPETQIIHYKGESTKKGDLRYVRLFYGAMLLFIEKHFKDRHSRLFAGVLRLGILGRATLSVASQALRRLRYPLLDGLVVMLCVGVLGWLRTELAGGLQSPRFFWTVVPGYAVATVLSVAAMGGYRLRGAPTLRARLLGPIIGFLLMSTASFLAPTIAYSRAVLLAAVPLSVLGLLATRAIRRAPTRGGRDGRALVVGSHREAQRLAELLASQTAPPFSLVGYVPPGTAPAARGGLPCLGRLRQLRDVVRIRRIDEVVFASADLSNHAIFHEMWRARGLSVQFRIFAEGRTHLIGKASIDDLASPGLQGAEAVVGRPRSLAARRFFEVSMTSVLALCYPVLMLATWVGGASSRWACRRRRLRGLGEVLAGRRALVGRQPGHEAAEPALDLPLGLFSIADTLPETASADELDRAYHFYIHNESAAVDCTILWAAWRRCRA